PKPCVPHHPSLHAHAYQRDTASKPARASTSIAPREINFHGLSKDVVARITGADISANSGHAHEYGLGQMWRKPPSLARRLSSSVRLRQFGLNPGTGRYENSSQFAVALRNRCNCERSDFPINGTVFGQR